MWQPISVPATITSLADYGHAVDKEDDVTTGGYREWTLRLGQRVDTVSRSES